MAEAGWYPNPDNQGQLRWWDGSTWTERVAERKPALPADFEAQLHPKAVEALRRDMVTGEAAKVAIIGTHAQAIVGTDRRAFVFKKGYLAGASFGSELTSWDYRQLIGVQTHTGMLTGAVILQAGGQSGKKTSYWGNDKDDPFKAPNAIPISRPFDSAIAAVAVLRGLIDAAHVTTAAPSSPAASPPEAPTPRPPSASPMEQLERLVQMRSEGLINDEDFEAMKRRIVHG